jgi:hypothetical protein
MGLNYGDCIKVFPGRAENGMMEGKYLYIKNNRIGELLRQFVNISPGKSILFFNLDMILPELLNRFKNNMLLPTHQIHIRRRPAECSEEREQLLINDQAALAAFGAAV